MNNPYSDAAKRVSDIHNMHNVCGHYGEWAAFKLEDGSSDGTPYPSRADAVNHSNPLHGHMFLKINPNGLTPDDAERLLFFYRAAYDNGYRVTDPAQPQFIMPMTDRDMGNWMREMSNR